MKVLLINNFHYRKGGSEAVYFNTAELLKKAGHNVVFFSIKRDENLPCEQAQYFVEKRGYLKQVRNYFFNPEAANKLEELILEEKPDIAHAHLFWGGITPSIFAILKKYGIPIIHTAHDYRMVCPAYTFRNGLGVVCEQCKGGKYAYCVKNRCSKGKLFQSVIMAVEMMFRNCKWHPAKCLDGIIYVSRFSKSKHEEIDPLFATVKSIVLYNFSAIGDDTPPLLNGDGHYLYYGRLSEEKGINKLLEVFARHPELTLKVVGTGPIEDKLRKEFDSDNRYDNIQFLGYLSGAPLVDLVRKSKFVCVPSECYENNPMTIVEAYSLGVPVIGARIGGIPEIVEERETGFLFESGNSVSLENVIIESKTLSEDDYITMKQNAFRFARVHFESNQYLNKLLAFYAEVIRDYSKQ